MFKTIYPKAVDPNATSSEQLFLNNYNINICLKTDKNKSLGFTGQMTVNIIG
jgi:hypothetical protein